LVWRGWILADNVYILRAAHLFILAHMFSSATDYSKI
jgi:hypothetical protein